MSFPSVCGSKWFRPKIILTVNSSIIIPLESAIKVFDEISFKMINSNLQLCFRLFEGYSFWNPEPFFQNDASIPSLRGSTKDLGAFV